MELKQLVIFLRVISESPFLIIFFVSFSYIFTSKLWRKFVKTVAF